MREVDRIAVDDETPNLFQMMENAGRHLAAATIALLGEDWSQIPVAVFAGSGNNGGGGVTAARHLANWGGDVTVVLAGEPGPGTAIEQQFEIYSQTTGRKLDSPSGEAGLILDALIGYGLTEAPRGRVADMIDAIGESDASVISLDVPSGMDGDSGDSPGTSVVPTQTITLALPKPGLIHDSAGDIWLADIGIPVGVYRRIGLRPSLEIFEHGPLVHLNRIVA